MTAFKEEMGEPDKLHSVFFLLIALFLVLELSQLEDEGVVQARLHIAPESELV